MNRLELLQLQMDALRRGERFAAVRIIEAVGLARTWGTMLVFPDGRIAGTVGGGPAELKAKQDALACLESGTNAVRAYDFSAELAKAGVPGPCRLTVSIELCEDERAPLIVVGGGHVGRALIRTAKRAGFRALLLGDRAPEQLGGAAEEADRFLRLDDFARIGRLELPAGGFFVICTYGPQEGAAAAGAVLARGDAAYLGLLSSRKKLRLIFDRLRAQGVSEAELDRIYAPIGLDLGGETPEELAISITAELMQVRHGRSGAHLRELSSQNVYKEPENNS